MLENVNAFVSVGFSGLGISASIQKVMGSTSSVITIGLLCYHYLALVLSPSGPCVITIELLCYHHQALVLSPLGPCFITIGPLC